MSRYLTVEEIIAGMTMEVLSGGKGILRKVTNQSLSKPGLELAGMFDYYEHDRIQVLGSKEEAFFRSLSLKDQEERVNKLFEKEPPAFVFSKNVPVPKLFLDLGEKHAIPVLRSNYQTSSLFSELFAFLQARLAERMSLHGVLMDINGVGVLITGKSGIGKSEVALELIRRGYMLVADDMVEIFQLEKGMLIGEAPELLKKYLEIRGIGIVNVIYLFGAKAYRESKRISLFVELEKWETTGKFDRLGLTTGKHKIFDTEIASVKLPITEARNTATLVEAAAYDYKAKRLGYHSGADFNKELNQQIKSNQKRNEDEE